MSLPASLTTDCGGLLNRRGPRRKCCCHMEALHAGYHVILFTRIVLVPNYRIVFSHGASRKVTGFCHELSNCRFFLHTENRGGHGLFTRVFFLSRIIEFANWFIFTRNIAESHGFIVTDLRIVDFFFTRNVADGHGGYEGGTIEA